MPSRRRSLPFGFSLRKTKSARVTNEFLVPKVPERVVLADLMQVPRNRDTHKQGSQEEQVSVRTCFS